MKYLISLILISTVTIANAEEKPSIRLESTFIGDKEQLGDTIAVKITLQIMIRRRGHNLCAPFQATAFGGAVNKAQGFGIGELQLICL